jgi:hypothetical protein
MYAAQDLQVEGAILSMQTNLLLLMYMYMRVCFNTIMYYILERYKNNRWAGTIMSMHTVMHTEKRPKLADAQERGDTCIKRGERTREIICILSEREEREGSNLKYVE